MNHAQTLKISQLHDELKTLVSYLQDQRLASTSALLGLLQSLVFWNGWNDGSPIDCGLTVRDLQSCRDLLRSLVNRTDQLSRLYGQLEVVSGLLRIAQSSATELLDALPAEARVVTLSERTRDDKGYIRYSGD